MKRKIVNGFLMMALVTSSMGSFVSCKDYEEDNLVEMRGKIESVNQVLQGQITSLQTSVTNLEAAKAKCESDLAALQASLSNYITKGEADATYLKISDYATKIANQETAIATLTATISALQEQVGNISGEKFAEVTTAINNVNIAVSAAQAAAEEAKALAVANGTEITNLQTAITELNTTIAGWNEQLTTTTANANEALVKAQANAANIDNLQALYDQLKVDYAAADTKLGERIDALTAELNAVKADVAEKLEAAKAEAKAYTDQVNTLATNAMNKATEAFDKADANATKLAELEAALASYVKTEEVQTEITQINANVTSVSGRVEEVENALNSLKDDLKAMITSIEVQGVTSPVVGYMSLPVGLKSTILAAYYGTTSSNGLEFPTELPRYYVDAAQVFTDREFDVMGLNDFTEVEGYTYIEPNTDFVGQKNGSIAGNAGKVYVTINPSNVNFSNKVLDIETSQAKAAPVTLSPLKYSDKELTFGFGTRAADNGFYEAEVTLTPEDIHNATMKIDLNDLKDIASGLIKDHSKGGIVEAGLKMMEVSNDVLPAYGLKASWQDKTNGDVHSIYSKYELAATAVKPLSFAFLKDLHVTKVPGIGRLQDLVAEMIRQIKIKIPTIPDIELTFGSINQRPDGSLAVEVELGERDIRANSSFTIQGGYVYDMEGNAIGQYNSVTQTITIKTTIDLGDDINVDFTDDINALITEINNKYTNPDNPNSVASQLADLLNSVQEFNKMSDYIDDAKENMIDGINKYITRANNALCSVINDANSYLKTALMAKQADGKVALLARSKNLATKASGELTLIPTSYTLEMFAPAYKKFLAVTNVYDAKTGNELPLAEAQAKAKAANGGENMMKVIDGNTTLTFNGEKGYLYQIAYAAVDYDSQVTVRRFYVQF
jgi:uncharacterized coiled-coil DUF342 family protein